MTVEGWNSEAPILRKLVEEIRPRVIIDVGVWKGGSTIHFARLLHDLGINGYVIAVDTWLGSVEHCEDLRIAPGAVPAPRLYDEFIENVSAAKLWTYVAPLPQTSWNAAQILAARGIRGDLVHIDAAHDNHSVMLDMLAYWGLLRPGGVLCGDDYHDACPGVEQSVSEFSRAKGVGLHVEDFKWVVRKP